MDLLDGVVADTLRTLGVEVETEDGDELYALCPGHKARTGKEDHNPSWSINARTGVHYCFSCQFRGNLITLVRDLDGEDAARSLQSEFTAHGRYVLADIADLDLSGLEPLPAETIRTANFRPESWLNEFTEPPRWALKARRITAAAAREFGVLWDEDHRSWVLPFRDPDTNRLLGYQSKSQGTRLFRNRPRSVMKSLTFFGWPTLSGRSWAVIVESPLDAVLLSDYDVPALAICGSRVSEEQLQLLRRLDRVHIWMDNDTAGELETKRLRSLTVNRGVQAEFITTESSPDWKAGRWKDVGDMPFSAIESCLETARI